MEARIVFTTIYPPTASLMSWQATGLKMFGIGDRKTPADWSLPGCCFTSAHEQDLMSHAFASKLPWNHYARKNLGYVMALKDGADAIVDVDDDTAPKPSWSLPDFSFYGRVVGTDTGWLNAYRIFMDQFVYVWPRGFPLSQVSRSRDEPTVCSIQRVKVGVWQGLVDVNPDVDAIHRLIFPFDFNFAERAPIALNAGSVCPFNSQNTVICRALFPLLYLPTTVSFRYTDILRGLVAQPIMWKYDYRLAFAPPNAIQCRNPHDLMADFRSEVPMYLSAESVPALVGEAIKNGKNMLDCLTLAYYELARRSIVELSELTPLCEWCEIMKPHYL
jgi:hypothetical protein